MLTTCTPDSFPILNGTMQGCPLSPILFILALEPFIRTVRNNSAIHGISVGHQQFKTSAYADGLLFSLTQPIISMSALLAEFETYGRLSNLRINFQKLVAISIVTPPPTVSLLQTDFPFQWMTTMIPYLGTRPPTNLKNFFTLNFPPCCIPASLSLTCGNTNTFHGLNDSTSSKCRSCLNFYIYFPPYLCRSRPSFYAL